MNSTLNESLASPNQTLTSLLQSSSSSGQPVTMQSMTQRPFVDATPIIDEKQNLILTDPMEINLHDILINLQHFVLQTYANLLEAPSNVSF